jgi:ribonuclease G
VIDQTEAMTVIDVNTGRFTGEDSLEETVFATNLEAAEEIIRLLRLRDIGGMIVIDFIDMMLEEHRQAVKKRLEEAAKTDRTKTLLVGWTKLGLFEMTRKKNRQTMDGQLYDNCPYCAGAGKVYSRLHPLHSGSESGQAAPDKLPPERASE